MRFVIGHKVGEYAARPRRIAAIVARWLSDPAAMREMAKRAKELGAPRATEQIADHIYGLRLRSVCATRKSWRTSSASAPHRT